MTHPTYGLGSNMGAFARIGDTVARTPDGPPLGPVAWITASTVWVDMPDEEQLVPLDATDLALIQRGRQ